MLRRQPLSTLFPYTTLFRSRSLLRAVQFRRVCPEHAAQHGGDRAGRRPERGRGARLRLPDRSGRDDRSEEHTSELQSRRDLVCRLLLEKKKTTQITQIFLLI